MLHAPTTENANADRARSRTPDAPEREPFPPAFRRSAPSRRGRPAPPLRPSQSLALQRTAASGKAGTGRPVPVFLQPKLEIGPVNDPSEMEADRAAEQVMGMQNPAASVPRPGLSAVSMPPPGGPAAPASVHSRSGTLPASRLMRKRGPSWSRASAMISAGCGCMTTPMPPASARAVGARAYTAGSDIVFGAGQRHAGSASGGRLLAHELAHTIQQGRSADSQSPVCAFASAARPGPHRAGKGQ